MEEQLRELREQVAALQASLDKKDVQAEKLQKKLDKTLYETKSILEEDRKKAKDKLKGFKEKVAKLQEALESKDNDVVRMQGMIEEAECENKILMEELDQLLTEKNAAEAAMNGRDEEDADVATRIEGLEQELRDATNVANLQLEELDEQVEELQEKLRAERLENSSKVKARDATIEELTTKLRKYEAVPSTTMHDYSFHPTAKPMSMSSVCSEDSFALPDDPFASNSTGHGNTTNNNAGILLQPVATTPTISTDDVNSIEAAKQKVYEARADATSVRESLEISTKKCAELTLANEALAKKNARLEDTTREREELKEKVNDWTSQTYQWKVRAEDAEKKLADMRKKNGGASADDSGSGIDTTIEDAPQGMMIQAAFQKQQQQQQQQQPARKGKWSIFGSVVGGVVGSNDNDDNNSEDATNGNNNNNNNAQEDSNNKDQQITTLEDTIAKLKSELVQMSTAHKEEAYLTKKRIAQLEGENEALTVQNGTLEQLSRFQEEH